MSLENDICFVTTLNHNDKLVLRLFFNADSRCVAIGSGAYRAQAGKPYINKSYKTCKQIATEQGLEFGGSHHVQKTSQSN